MFGKVKNKEPITVAEAKEFLAGIDDKNYFQERTFEYTAKFAKISLKKAKELVKELQEAGIPRIKARHLIKLADLLPETQDELRAILAKEDLTLNKEDSEKVLEIVAKYR